jgi:hypothetical protein
MQYCWCLFCDTNRYFFSPASRRNICVSCHYKKFCLLFLFAIAYSDCYPSLTLAHVRFDPASIYVSNSSHLLLGAKPLFLYPSSQIRSDSSTRLDEDCPCVLGSGSPKRPIRRAVLVILFPSRRVKVFNTCYAFLHDSFLDHIHQLQV